MNNSESIQLESISLSNIRRFGEDVTIRFGSGATILLAPNGSGKTAVFEAIELALTSAVQRVEERVPHLIRDGLQHASVRLNFGAWQREVSIFNDKVSVIEAGRIEELFHGVDPKEIPFLLRLTHLLDQRDRSWFCQQKPDDAGGQLDMLPLGREASQVSATVGRLRPAVTRTLTDIAAVKAAKEDELKLWIALTTARDNAANELSGPLVSLAELEGRLQTALGDISLQLDTIAALREQWAIASAAVNQHIADYQSELNTLGGLTTLPAAHLQTQEFLTRTSQELKAHKEARSGHEAEIKTKDEQLTATEPRREQLEAELTAAKEKLQRKQLHQRTAELVTRLGEEFQSIKLSIDRHNVAFDAASLAYQGAVSNNEVHDALRGLAVGLAQRQHDLMVATTHFEKWKGLSLERSTLEVQSKTCAATVAALVQAIESAKATTEEKQSGYTHAKSTADTYRQAAGAIRSAVSTIAESLPSNVGTCPVCSVNHGQEELRRRIAAALSAIDPHLNEATQALQRAATDLDAAKKAESEKRTDLKLAQDAHQELAKKIAEIDSQIAVARSHYLLLGLEFDAVAERLSALSKEIATESAALDTRKAATPAPPDADAMTALSTRYAEAKTEQERLAESHARKLESLSDAKRELDQIDLGTDVDTSIETLNQSVEDIEKEFNAIVAQMRQASNRKLELSAMLQQGDTQISRLSNQLSLSEVESATRIGQWTSAGLQDLPSTDALEVAKVSVAERLKTAQDVKSSLAEIELELNRHAEAHALEGAQRAVDEVRGDHTEEAYSQMLQQSLRAVKERYDRAATRKDALDAFAMHLTNGIGRIRGEVQNIVPQWQAILKRIVQDPRFSETSLSYLKKRNKNVAEVAVNVGAMQAPVADIASQAQMTDLQLSFLLSMATVHQWSPWKALLLDDPTQHHDLVHAASVFDVLRDFISEQGYQVVLTTHDALQARFLMRKLSNDGIDARLWTLRPSESGMVAHQIGGRQGL